MSLNITLGDDVPLTIPQATAFSRVLRLQWTDRTDPDAPVVHRIPTNGYQGRGQVRSSQRLEAHLLCTFTVDVSQVSDESDPDCGRITFSAGATQTVGIDHDGFYNVELFNPNDLDDVVRIIQGPVAKDRDVTADE